VRVYIGKRMSEPPWDERPCHPVTGARADYYFHKPNGTGEWCWRQQWKKSPDPRISWYSAGEVADMAGVSRETVSSWLISGALKGAKPKGRWFILGADVIDFMAGRSDVSVKIEPLAEVPEE